MLSLLLITKTNMCVQYISSSCIVMSLCRWW